MSADNLVRMLYLGDFESWIAVDDREIGYLPRLKLEFDLMRVPGFEDVFGLLIEGSRMVLFKDIVEEHGMMWHELVDIKKEYVSAQRLRISGKTEISGVGVGLFGYESDRRVTKALARHLVNRGARVGIFVQSMTWSEYRRLREEFDVRCVEICL